MAISKAPKFKKLAIPVALCLLVAALFLFIKSKKGLKPDLSFTFKGPRMENAGTRHYFLKGDSLFLWSTEYGYRYITRFNLGMEEMEKTRFIIQDLPISTNLAPSFKIIDSNSFNFVDALSTVLYKGKIVGSSIKREIICQMDSTHPSISKWIKLSDEDNYFPIEMPSGHCLLALGQMEEDSLPRPFRETILNRKTGKAKPALRYPASYLENNLFGPSGLNYSRVFNTEKEFVVSYAMADSLYLFSEEGHLKSSVECKSQNLIIDSQQVFDSSRWDDPVYNYMEYPLQGRYIHLFYDAATGCYFRISKGNTKYVIQSDVPIRQEGNQYSILVLNQNFLPIAEHFFQSRLYQNFRFYELDKGIVIEQIGLGVEMEIDFYAFESLIGEN